MFGMMAGLQRAFQSKVCSSAVCVLLALTPARAADFLYALTYKETAESIRAHRSYVPLHYLSDAQKLLMVRHAVKNEIVSVSMTNGKRSVLFLDDGPNFEITDLQGGLPMVALGGSRAYVKGIERGWRGQPNPGTSQTALAVYEIALDGSNSFRKVFEIKEDQYTSGMLLADPGGKKLAYVGTVNGHKTISIYASDGVELETWDVDKILKPHCQQCECNSMGWMSDGSGLFFTLEPPNGDDWPPPNSHDELGTFMVSEDGKERSRIPADLGRVELPGYRRVDAVTPGFLGQARDGSYIFSDFAWKLNTNEKQRTRAQGFIVSVNPLAKTRRQLPLSPPPASFLFQLSPSGRYAAFSEERVTKEYRSEWHLWGRDLQSAEEKELFVLPAPPLHSSDPQVSVKPIGWLEE